MHLSLEPYLPIALLSSNTFSGVERRKVGRGGKLLLSGTLCLAINGISWFLSKEVPGKLFEAQTSLEEADAVFPKLHVTFWDLGENCGEEVLQSTFFR